MDERKSTMGGMGQACQCDFDFYNLCVSKKRKGVRVEIVD
jgi:hypothetical protein